MVIGWVSSGCSEEGVLSQEGELNRGPVRTLRESLEGATRPDRSFGRGLGDKGVDSVCHLELRLKSLKTSLAVQWLRPWTANAGVQLPSLVWELISHMPCAATVKAIKLTNIKRKKVFN